MTDLATRIADAWKLAERYWRVEKNFRSQGEYIAAAPPELVIEMADEIARLTAEVICLKSDLQHWPATAKILSDAVRKSRNKALDEAAEVAKHYEPKCDVCPSGVTNAILALKSQEPKS